MLNRFDWKFLLMAAIAIAGIAIPVWIWQTDLNSKAITLTVKSFAELQPQGISELDGVQLIVDGRPLMLPFVSTLEISNSGSKPIVASDFEGPIRISSTLPSIVVRLRPTSSTPTSLVPALAVADGAVFLQPLRLNPGDVVSLTLITANGDPKFKIHGRIA